MRVSLFGLIVIMMITLGCSNVDPISNADSSSNDTKQTDPKKEANNLQEVKMKDSSGDSGRYQYKFYITKNPDVNKNASINWKYL